MTAERGLVGPRLTAVALAVVALATLAQAPAAAQLGSFGQNKIHYRHFDWQVLRGEHVDLYFYPEEEELARVALAYAEESYRFLSVKFEHAPRRRIPLIIYASHVDFEQTNLLPFVPPEGLLGFTEFLRRRVALPFNGSYAQFRQTLRHELVHAFTLSIEAQVSERYPRVGRARLPLWFTEGLAEYWAGAEDSRDEMILRDLTVGGRLPSLPALTYVQSGIVYPLGGVIHEWLAEAYGEWRVALLFHDLWKYETFDAAMEGTYGKSLERLSDEWRHWMRRRYYPVVTHREPLAIRARQLSELAIKPAVYVADSTRAEVFYLSPRTGYTNIYAQPLSERGESRVVVEGERTPEFESLHPFYSRLDISPEGVIVFASRYLERDAVFFWDIEHREVVGRYQFPELVSILSPAWTPDGQSVVFSALSLSGYSDLYRMEIPSGKLTRLTSDRYQDLDPSVSPDGRLVVFASDRTPFGATGSLNLFLLDLETGAIHYLTHGPWRDEGPRWSWDNDRIYFSSDRSGMFEIYSCTADGAGRREVRTFHSAFDPQWVPEQGVVVFGGFEDLSFHIYAARPDTSLEPAADAVAAMGSSPDGIALGPARAPAGQWRWEELDDPRYARADAMPYDRKFSLEFAAGDALLVPGVGSVQGATLLFSDLLSDHLLFVGLSSFQGDGLGGVVDNLNGNVLYLNQSRRLNWGVGAYRVRGLFYEGDFETVYEESAFGGYGVLRFPFTRFHRVEAQYRVERSTRIDLVSDADDQPRREGFLAANYLSYVKDNTLWLTTGPIDGERYNVTLGGVSDLSNARFDSWVASADYRRYIRLGMRTAYAVRGYGYYAGGERPRRVNIGGSWALRGYPRFGVVAGTRAVLLTQELRFPLTDFLSVGFPIGELRFPGVQGAIFADAGRAWTGPTEGDRGVLGSAGFGLRMPLGPPLVLRLDLGWRFSLTGEQSGYSLSRDFGGRFVDFFFGFNY